MANKKVVRGNNKIAATANKQTRAIKPQDDASAIAAHLAAQAKTADATSAMLAAMNLSAKTAATEKATSGLDRVADENMIVTGTVVNGTPMIAIYVDPTRTAMMESGVVASYTLDGKNGKAGQRFIKVATTRSGWGNGQPLEVNGVKIGGGYMIKLQIVRTPKDGE